MRTKRLTSAWIATFGAGALIALVGGCASSAAQRIWYPIPEPPPVGTPPLVRGDEASATRLSRDQRLEVLREVVRAFFRPSPGQARWIDPRPLAHRRSRAEDGLVMADDEWATAIAQAVGLRRVCARGPDDGDCRGRQGGVLRFSAPYAATLDSAIVFAQYAAVGVGAVPGAETNPELEFRLVRSDGRWRIVSKRSMASPR